MLVVEIFVDDIASITPIDLELASAIDLSVTVNIDDAGTIDLTTDAPLDVVAEISTGPEMNVSVLGNVGVQGIPGSKWYTASGTPSGALGVLGDFYLDSATGDYYEKTAVATWTLQGNLLGPQGPQGIQGIPGNDGADGTDGVDGAVIFTQSGAPAGGLGVDGDLYINTDNGDYYQKVTGSWVLQGNLTGPQGIQGIPGNDGADGALWFTASGAPAGGLGSEGDFYLDAANGDYYEKTAPTVWTLQGNLKGVQGDPGNDGADGADGATIYVASGVPSNGLGNDGDLYINSDDGELYLKVTGSWISQGNLTGPQGPQGIQGIQGVPGNDGADGDDGSVWHNGSGAPAGGLGVVGDYYIDNDSGDYYEKTGASTWTLRGNLEGPAGAGTVASVVGGTNITVDSSDPNNPVVNLDPIGQNDLADTTITSPVNTQVLQYNGSMWVNAALAISDVTGLQTALDGKADSVHTHVIADVTGLQTALDGKLGTGDNAVSATVWQTARTLTLTGDVTGVTAAFDGSSNITLSATVVDDSHNHIIANVDGLQTTLDGKADDGHNLTTHGDVTITTPATSQVLRYNGSLWVNSALAISDVTGLQTALDGKLGTGDTAVAATVWETARTLTLTGDVTGVSAAFDGSGNISITATVVDDSHNHVISNVDGLQTALDGKADTGHNLGTHGDVTLTSPTDGQVLTYDSGSGDWVNADSTGGGGFTPEFAGRRSGTGNYTSGNKIEWSTDVDTSAGISYNSTNREFTVPAGTYLVSMNIQYDVNAAYIETVVSKNSTGSAPSGTSTNIITKGGHGANAADATFTCTGIVTCAEDDTIQVWVVNGTVNGTDAGGDHAGFISIVQIGE